MPTYLNKANIFTKKMNNPEQRKQTEALGMVNLKSIENRKQIRNSKQSRQKLVDNEQNKSNGNENKKQTLLEPFVLENSPKNKVQLVKGDGPGRMEATDGRNDNNNEADGRNNSSNVGHGCSDNVGEQNTKVCTNTESLDKKDKNGENIEARGRNERNCHEFN